MDAKVYFSGRTNLNAKKLAVPKRDSSILSFGMPGVLTRSGLSTASSSAARASLSTAEAASSSWPRGGRGKISWSEIAEHKLHRSIILL